ncbi:anthranilate phosphoribosyltransferase [Anaeromicropila herbilytica]|uniref:Anthranilate phosphoribosyltransferase n=1 Tax=Anaeromicropila herbilytica TaxID=2785025 RepID=A0A7R7IDI3_9FIRM|nr:anthranilate phosphoribosyltransferase [Anaeromicropila herbilytica]BCN31582.1 anthranilate phosphoribosyltransferase [Anaeromicropila herbilytica]
MKKAIKAVVEGNNLSIEEAKRAMNLMLSGEATQAQIGAFLTALRLKGETLDEIVGCATVLRDKAEHISPKVDNYIDIVGTGGDCTYSFNISTTSSFVVAGAGLVVAKHGNRSVSSKSGAADVLEELGVNIMLEPKKVEQSVEEIGIGFMFAQTFNKSMKYVGQARSEMGIRSIFNILGPLSNPSGAKHQVIGVFNPDLTEVFAQAMRIMGIESALVVNAKDGMDEISNASDTVVSEIKDGKVINYVITPEQFGFKRTILDCLTGGDAKANANITLDILSGTKGYRRDIVLFNAGATLYAGHKAMSIEEGIMMAEESIDSGKAMDKLIKLIEFSRG